MSFPLKPIFFLTLYRAEKEILDKQAITILDSLPFGNGTFQLVELGSGDGSKTISLVEQMFEVNKDIGFKAIDISHKALDVLSKCFLDSIPGLDLECLRGDYFELLKGLPNLGIPRLFLLMGGNFGNYSPERGLELLQKLHSLMNPGDYLMLGWDKHKDPKRIQDAYMDSQGLTRRFNLNLLDRMNRELEANFDTNKFGYHASYDLNSYTVFSHLISLENQEVYIRLTGDRILFEKDEPIYTECSRKFTLSQIEETVHEVGFLIHQNLEDSKSFYAISLLYKS